MGPLTDLLDKEKRKLKKLRKTARDQSIPPGKRAETWWKIASKHEKKKRFFDAASSYLNSAEEYRKAGEQPREAESYRNAAVCYQKAKDDRSANDCLRKAAEVYDLIGWKKEASECREKAKTPSNDRWPLQLREVQKNIRRAKDKGINILKLRDDIGYRWEKTKDLYSNGNINEAKELANKLKGEISDEILKYQGKIERLNQKHRIAESTYEKGLDMYSNEKYQQAHRKLKNSKNRYLYILDERRELKDEEKVEAIEKKLSAIEDKIEEVKGLKEEERVKGLEEECEEIYRKAESYMVDEKYTRAQNQLRKLNDRVSKGINVALDNDLDKYMGEFEKYKARQTELKEEIKEMQKVKGDEGVVEDEGKADEQRSKVEDRSKESVEKQPATASKSIEDLENSFQLEDLTIYYKNNFKHGLLKTTIHAHNTGEHLISRFKVKVEVDDMYLEFVKVDPDHGVDPDGTIIVDDVNPGRKKQLDIYHEPIRGGVDTEVEIRAEFVDSRGNRHIDTTPQKLISIDIPSNKSELYELTKEEMNIAKLDKIEEDLLTAKNGASYRIRTPKHKDNQIYQKVKEFFQEKGYMNARERTYRKEEYLKGETWYSRFDGDGDNELVRFSFDGKKRKMDLVLSGDDTENVEDLKEVITSNLKEEITDEAGIKDGSLEVEVDGMVGVRQDLDQVFKDLPTDEKKDVHIKMKDSVFTGKRGEQGNTRSGPRVVGEKDVKSKNSKDKDDRSSQPPSPSPVCPECGKQIESSDMKHCTHCGAKLKDT